MRNKSRPRRKKKKTIVAQRQGSFSPVDLYKEENFEGAARMLREQLAVEPTDDRKALLAECLYHLKENHEAINVIVSMESCDSYLLELAGVCCLRLEDYESAKSFLTRALQQSQHPHTYYLLAIAYGKGQKRHEQNAETKESISGLLRKAIAMPECPLDAFLWLEALRRYEDPDIEASVKILEKAISLYPDSEEARVRLAGWYTYRLQQPGKALEVLQPLIIQNTENPQVWMRAFYASKEMGEQEAALQFIERVQPTDEGSRINLTLLKADTHLYLERFDDAHRHYSEVIKEECLDERISALFGRAWTNIKLGRDVEALEDTQLATNIVLNSDVYLSYAPFYIEGEMYGYNFVGHVKNVSKYYIERSDQETNVGSELLGGLYYLLYEIGLEDPEEDEGRDAYLILKAGELNAHPKISKGLSGYLAEQKKWSQAVDHHLKFSLWAHAQNFTVHVDTPFFYKAEDNEATISKTERSKITKIAIKYFEQCIEDEEAMRAVLEPFYRQFWRDLLLKDSMSGVIVKITTAVLENGCGDKNTLWDHAFHLARVGEADKAEKAYRKLLEQQPNNASAIHNLSIILENKGFFQEAFELSSHAASLAPSNDVIMRRLEDLKSKAKRIHIQKRSIEETKTKDSDEKKPKGVTTRKGLSQKLRFEVFKRDSFTCQYCGRKAPDVVLQVDHIDPSSKGGTDDILNLITSCKECNAGKSDRRLSDNTVLEKQRKQLEELQERKEQIEMMFQWQKQLLNLDEQTVEQVAELWGDLVNPFTLNENGKAQLKKLIRQFSLTEVMDAMRISASQYIEYEGDTPTKESVEKAWSKVGGICRIKRQEQDRPYMRDLHYIKGILRNRLSYTKDWVIIKRLEESVLQSGNVERLKAIALEARNWTQWNEMMDEYFAELQS